MLSPRSAQVGVLFGRPKNISRPGQLREDFPHVHGGDNDAQWRRFVHGSLTLPRWAGSHEFVFLGLQIAQSRSYLHAVRPEVGTVYKLGALGSYVSQGHLVWTQNHRIPHMRTPTRKLCGWGKPWLSLPTAGASITTNTMAGPALLAVSKWPQSQFQYCWWYRSSRGSDFDISEIAGPVWSHTPSLYLKYTLK